MSETDQPDAEIRFLRESQAEFDTFKSIVHGLEKHLFPPGKIRNEASDVEICDNLLTSDDIKRYLKPEFIEILKGKLAMKAKGIKKQAETENKILNKFGK